MKPPIPRTRSTPTTTRPAIDLAPNPLSSLLSWSLVLDGAADVLVWFAVTGTTYMTVEPAGLTETAVVLDCVGGGVRETGVVVGGVEVGDELVDGLDVVSGVVSV